ncbi:VWA domain-containing protein [Spirochaetes bacterium]|uniref:VWA domain-containing protein n=1 Tax=Candidatus Scatousia excrementipullorum TaxID=2840936 RepID=A0A9D9DTG9_9BACT|nr:VWA domain-containing protein [Candidatus Scatousia excrementipullorum]
MKIKVIIASVIIGIAFAGVVPVFAKKEKATVYKQSDLIKQQINVYTPDIYRSGDLVQSGLGIRGDVIELVVDYSGSMDRWIKLAVTTLKSILPKISPETNVGLRVFGQDTGQIFITAMFTGCQATEQIVRPAKQNTAEVIRGLNKSKIGYSTPLTYALKRTVYGDFSGISHNTKKKIVLVTDGGESCNGDPCEFIRSIAALRKDIIVDVIMVNGSNSLKCLSDATGGRYYNINNAQDFGTAMGVSFETLPENAFKNTNQNNNVQTQGIGDGYHYEYVP